MAATSKCGPPPSRWPKSAPATRLRSCASPGTSATAILPTVIAPDRLLIRRDHVIEDMVRGLGGNVTHIAAPFDPEGGAYAGAGHAHGHDHD